MANKGNRAVIQFFQSFDSNLRTRWVQFLSSPYCTQEEANNPAFRVAVYLHEKYKSNQPLEETDDLLFAAAYPFESFSERKYNDLMSKSLKLTKKFIESEMLLSQTHQEPDYYMMQFYNKTGDQKKFIEYREKVKAWQSNKTNWTAKEHFENFLIELEEVEFLSKNNQKKDDLNLIVTIRNLDEYFFIQRLYLTCALLNRNLQAPLALLPINEFLPFDVDALKNQWFFAQPLGRLFRSALTVLEGGNVNAVEQFAEFDQLVQSYGDLVSPIYLSDFETYICNYYVIQINFGKQEFYHSLFIIIKRREESGRCYVDGKIHINDFQSYVTVGLRANEHKWVLNFIEKNKDNFIGTDFPNGFYEFNLANYYFHIKEYSKTKEILARVTFEDVLRKIYAKLLEIKVFYESGDHELLYSKIDAARMFFFRNEGIEKNKREHGKNFVSMMQQIEKLPPSPSGIEIDRLIAKINTQKHVAERIWLLEKLQALKKKS